MIEQETLFVTPILGESDSASCADKAAEPWATCHISDREYLPAMVIMMYGNFDHHSASAEHNRPLCRHCPNH
jgi:hypothetical protein